MAYIGKGLGGQGVRTRYYYTATGGETSLSGADDNSRVLSFADGEYVDVYLNGVLLVNSEDYNTTTANTISGLAALDADDIVEIVVYDIFSIYNNTINGTFTVNGGNTTLTGDLTVDTDTLYVDSTNNRVGIGTTSPNVSLHLQNSTSADDDARVRLISGTSGEASILLGDTGYGSRGRIVYDNSDDTLQFWGANSTTSAQRATIDSSGNVGIGTTPPSNYWGTGDNISLHTPLGYLGSNGNYAVSLYSNGYRNDSGGFTYLGINSQTSTASGIDLEPSGTIKFRTGTATGTALPQVATIFSDGDVQIGETTAQGRKLTVRQSGTNGVARFIRTTNTDSANAVVEIIDSDSGAGGTRTMLNLDYDDDANVDGAYFIRFQDEGGTIGRVEANSSSVSYITTSDYRLKTNVADYGSAIDKVKNLRPVSFDWVNTGNSDVGFIAHELAEHVPNVVSGTKDAMTTKEKADGTTTSVIDPQGVDYGKLTPYLTAALQEAIAKIEALETKVAALEASD